MKQFDVGDLATVKATGECVAIQEVHCASGSELSMFCRSILHPERSAELLLARDLILRATAQG